MANQNSVVPVTPTDKVISNITMTNSELLETKSVLARLGLSEQLEKLDNAIETNNVSLVEKAPRKTHKHFCTDSKNLENITKAEKAVDSIESWEYNPLTLNKGEVEKALLIGDAVDSTITLRKVVDVKLNFKTETSFYDKDGKLLTVPEKAEDKETVEDGETKEEEK